MILHTILTVIQIILAVALIAIVTLQSGKSSGLSGAISGASESFFAKNGSTFDGFLAKLTKWVALAFVLLTFALNLF